VQTGGFNAASFIKSHHGFFPNEEAMAAASVTRVLTSREHTALPAAWVAQPEFDDNVPASITEAFVQAYQGAGGQLEREHFPGARHGFIRRESPEAEKAIALMRDFIGRQLRPA
jgi:acetyl esterase/lipase